VAADCAAAATASPAAAVASADAAGAGVAASNGSPLSNGNIVSAYVADGRSIGSSRHKGKKQGLLPAGPWWPKSFGPVHLAVTCHWYTTLLGWHLATW
jgi:hypothetical protein